MQQLEFFDRDKIEVLKCEFEKVRQSNDNVRKGIFAKHANLERLCFELQSRLNIIERNICKGDNV